MRLSVVIVSYNVKYFLEQCLISLRRAIKDIETEVFVVDNNSSDDSVKMVREKFPEVRLVVNQYNPGFAIANNQAIRKASGKYVLLLNPDTVVGEDSLQQCVQFMDQYPETGGLGVRMIDGSGTFLPESKRGFPSPWVAFCKAFGLSRMFPRSRFFNHYHLGYLSEKETHSIEVLAGAFMFLRAESLQKVGLLDEQFFMYGEDIDLSYRLTLGGYKNVYLPTTTIIHYKGESTKKGSLNYVRVFYQAMILFARKHFRGAGATFFVGILNLAVYFRASLSLLVTLIRRIYLPFADALLLFGGLVLLKNFWANYHFRNPDYYTIEVLTINFPLYVFIWLISIYFSGGYDQPIHIRRLIRGILVGAILLAAVYGFLPMHLRSSRALILLGTTWAVIVLPLFRILSQLFTRQSITLGPELPRNLAIVGTAAETERALRYLDAGGARKNYIGRISPQLDDKSGEVLGNTLSLKNWITLFRIDELLFCSRDLRYQRIIDWMDQIGPKLLYKILPEDSPSIIGSQSKNTSGQLYTLESRYNIAQAAERRNKRVLDLLVATFIILTWPLLVWRHTRPLHYLKNAALVFIGLRTWVGYFSAKSLQLPALKKGILTTADISPNTPIDFVTADQIDQIYARDYRMKFDLDIIWKAWHKLDQRT